MASLQHHPHLHLLTVYIVILTGGVSASQGSTRAALSSSRSAAHGDINARDTRTRAGDLPVLTARQGRGPGVGQSVHLTRWDYGNLYEEWLASKQNISDRDVQYWWSALQEEHAHLHNNVSSRMTAHTPAGAVRAFIEQHGVTDAFLDALEDTHRGGLWVRDRNASLGAQQDARVGHASAPQYRLYGKPRRRAPKRDKLKVEQLGRVLRERVDALRSMPGQKLELIFLVDSSSTIGRTNFANELKFVSKLLIDFTVDRLRTRVALVTFSSKDRVVRHVDHLSEGGHEHNKCSLLEHELSRIQYTGGATDTLGAFKEAERILASSRPGAHRAVFLVTDGYSNFGDPRPLAASLRAGGVEVFSFGIMQGNTAELLDLASDPKNEHAYLLDTFDEFEALARRALHTDLPPGDYVSQPLRMCDSLCHQRAMCCDVHATCRCGTHTGRYECICGAGYYGSGHRHSCHPCPSGTYKRYGRPGDVATCTKCPDVNHISLPGSTSVSACVCKAGYRVTGNNQCAAMMCPPLEPPAHGYFVQECHNVFHAGCGIRCDTGYKMADGSSVRICQNNGTWSGRQPRCVVRRCKPLKAPKNGQIACTNEDSTFNTTCHFTCLPGFQRVGSAERSCLSIQHWNGITPRCREVQCPPLPELEDGTVTLRECTQRRMAVNRTCLLRCKSGFRMAGHDRKMCMPDGKWSPREGATNKCVDVQPPIILCRDDVTAMTQPGKSTARVTWRMPTAVDNSGFRPTVTVVPVLRADAEGFVNADFPIGSSTLTYTAVDRNKNQASCSFNIIVVDKEPPTVDNCTSPRPFIAKGRPVHVTWDEPVFTDNSLRTPTVSRDRNPGIFPPGVTMVTYTATDASGNNSTCTIRINVQENACADPGPPQHGKAHCTPARAGVVCTLQCNPGYGFAMPPPERYFCDLNTGYWLPANRWPFPDCSASRLSNHVTQFNNVVLHASTTCADQVYVTQVQEGFINTVSNRISEYCAPHLRCDVRDTYSQCEPRIYVDEEDIQTNYIEESPPDSDFINNNLGALPFGQQGRTVRTAPLREESTIKVTFRIEGVMTMEENAVGSSQQVQSELIQKLKQVVIKLEDAANLGEFDINDTEEPVKVKAMSMKGLEPEFKCKPGSILQKTHCVKCPIGTFYNVVSQECEGCLVGTYQPEEGSDTCLVCPTNTSTVSNNSKSVSQCKGQCLPGSFSSDGLEQCKTCPIGQYQPQYGQEACLACPGNLTTWRRGARTRDACAARCPAGYVSHSGLALTRDPCLACPRGYFQPERGNTSCLLCPGGVRTPHKASTSVTDCEGITAENVEDYRLIPIRELIVNECFAEPCQNGATCESLAVSYVCHCDPGWTGLNCESEIDECLSSPCRNNATCRDLVDQFQCFCLAGFTGSHCEVDIDDCVSSPCLNNATCRDAQNSYTCACAKGFDGTYCENNIDDCQPDPCQNGGVCLDHVTAYTCTCPPGYQGKQCEENVDECSSSPCQNNATCVDDINSFRCECVAGFVGDLCQTEVNECESSPCLNGATCLDERDNFRCECPPSYTGATCETQLNSSFVMTWNASLAARSFLRLDCCHDNLTEVSVAFWIRTRDTSNFGTPLSYATSSHDNELSITDYSGFTLYVHGHNKVTDVQAADGKWHHIAVTWSSRHGNWKIYKDGALQDSGDGLAKGEVIEGGGVLVAGQDQDGRGEQFNTREAFIGSLTRLNVWSEVLTLQQVRHLTTSCDDYDDVGTLVAWPDFLAEVHGDVKKTDSSFCKDCEPPPPISHGNVTYNGTSVETSHATYTCDAGFDLIGQQSRKCVISSEWDGDSPYCKKKRCPMPDDIPNGVVNGPWLRYGDTIRYHCSAAYRLAGNATRFCNADGVWEGAIPVCHEITCDPPIIESPLSFRDNGDRKSQYRPGDRLRLRCLHGYRLEGRGAMTCGEDGAWESVLPRCQQLNCGPVPPIPHGRVRPPGRPTYPAGSDATYVCDEGYALDGPDTIYCQDQGTWEAFRPQCKQVTCVPPSDIPHGEPKTKDSNEEEGYTYVVGSIVTYMCSRGFEIDGEQSIECTSDGLWNASTPACEKIWCPKPEPPTNGSVRYISHRFRDITSYACSEGFILRGAPKRICMFTRAWSSEPPICEGLSCGEPESILNGFILGSSHTYGDTVTYECNPGYVLDGFPERLCNVEGDWINPLPSCHPVECPTPSTILHGRYVDSNFKFQSTIEYICDADHRLTGNSSRVCQSDGSWSGESPFCERIKCMEPKTLLNGVVSAPGHEYNTGVVVKYKCSLGYSLEGKNTRTCRGDGTWTGPLPKCKSIFCKRPNEIINGNVNYNNMKYGTMAEYSCMDGYQLDGPTARMCSADKSWSGAQPSCEAITCPKPESISHGQLDAESLSMGSVITYKCDLGHRLVGPSTRTCLQNQTWSYEAPWCKSVECQRPSRVISNGRMISTNFTYGNTIHYICDSGYEVNGHTTRTCRWDGVWNETIPVCEKVSCPKPLAPPNSVVEGYDFRYKESVTYRCKRGYELIGEGKRHCTAEKTWSHEAPECAKIECPQPESIENGQVRVEGTSYKNKVRFVCDYGYRLSGEGIQTCNSDKTWSGTPPRCLQVRCDPPPSIDYGIVLNNRNNIFFGDVIQYRCDPGYVLSNASMLTCSTQGGYTGQIPICVPIKCSPPEQVTDGDVVGSSEGNSRLRRGYGAMIEYVCRKGYELFGNKYRRCNIHGKWSGNPPECHLVTCPLPNEIKGGSANISSELRFGDRIVYTCDEGKLLSGNKIRTCTANRTWSSTDPKCDIMQCSYPVIKNGYVDLGDGILGDGPDYANHFYNDDTPKYNYGEEIDVVCELGHVIEGKKRISCAGNGVWKPNIPSCKPVQCNTPRIENGLAHPSDPVNFGTEVTISCHEGYRIVGDSSVRCPADVAWIDLPECVLVTCPAPYFSHGNMSVVRSPNRGSGYPYGMTIKFNCHVGYEMAGVNTITCQDSGQWSEEVPRCEAIRCDRPDLSPDTHAYVLTYGLQFRSGENITLDCIPGYEPASLSTMHCSLVGKWTGSTPSCTVATCSAPAFENGKVFSRLGHPMKDTQIGDIATFRCDKGFSLVGRRELVCLANKTWSSDLPNCERVKCQNVDINNGRVISARGSSKYFLFGMKALFTCSDGYELLGESELTCGPEGHWSGELPSCNKIRCPSPSLEFGHLEPPSVDGHYRYNDDVTVTCHEGYQLSDSLSVLTCRSDGTWSTRMPKCSIQRCATPVLTNGKVTTIHPDGRQIKGFNVYGQSIRFECKQGHRRVGLDFAVCQANGTWSREIPKCEVILCPQLMIQNGRVANFFSASSVLGSRLRIQCLIGYEVHGNNELECVGDGKWQGANPKCFPKQCPTPQITHGKIIGSVKSGNGSYGFTFGDSIRVVCDNGYELVGTAEMICRADKMWSVSYPPRCDEIMCPPFPKVENSQITVMSEKDKSNDIASYMKYGTSVQVGCMPGYQLDQGDSRLTCGSQKAWMGKVPECKPLACTSLKISKAKIISRNSGSDDIYMLGSTVKIVCNEGYVITSGDDELTCLGNGTWSEAPPTCTRRRCSVVSVQNGRVIGESFLYGDTVQFICNEGYALLGAPTCRCQANGEWNCMPLCFRISCSRPEIIDKGIYVATGFFFGDRLQYQCETGYTMQGEADHVCQADMTWSGEAPLCHRTSCPNPTPPVNGEIIGTSYSYGDRIEFLCNEGFRMVGNQYSECMADKTWGPTPECIRITCPDPPDIGHGRAVGHSKYSKSLIRYVCEEGYSSRGNIELYCEESGTWRGSPPECIPITCPPPVRSPNGFVLGTQRSYKSEVEHHCSRGFKMRGQSKQTCTANATWSGYPPRCEVITCNGPAPLTNGHIAINAYFFGSVITYNCDYGYSLDGVPSRICRENGTWSDQDPRCVPITCPVPPRITNGIYMGTDTKIDSIVFYTCSPEYKLKGNYQRVCQQNATWSGTDPTCELKECTQPSAPEHGTMSGESFLAGSTVSFHCDEGYSLSGPATLTCVNGDHWSHDIPLCSRISCDLPREIEHGSYSDISFFYQDVVTYKCDTGYSRQGNPEVTCQSTGLWSPVEVHCVVGDCGNPPYVSFASASQPFRCETGMCVSYTCDEGYKQNGPHKVHCGPDGRWIYPLPKCEAKSCGTPPIIFHSSTTVTELESGGRIVEYLCNIGYTLEGNANSICMPNGTWMFDRRPRCVPLDCGQPPAVPNSIVLASEHTVGNFARYRCDTGFKMVGHAVIRCHVDGAWNDTGPVCVGLTCPHPEMIDNAYINGSDFSLGASIEYICSRGYLPAGETNRTCKDGHWVGAPPACQVVQCKELQVPANGHLSTQLRNYNTVVTVTCNPGYQLLGNETLACLETGEWNSPLPRCSYFSGPPCPPPFVPDHVVVPPGPFHTADVITLTCAEGYIAEGNMDVICSSDQSWTRFDGACRVAYCGPPHWPDPNLVVRLVGRSYSFGSRMVYTCRNGLTPATHTILTCTARGVWDNTPSCVASCKFECQNGGSCVGTNKCKCQSGYTGRFCEQAVCIMQCLNGGRCTAPYHCECPFGYTGPRCQKAVCNRACANGGRCIRPNRCQCPRGFKPPFCEEANPTFSIDSQARQNAG